MTQEMNTSKLRRYNIIAGLFHLVQMIAVLALANDFTLPIVARYMSGPPGSTFADPITLFDTPVGIGVALFLGLSPIMRGNERIPDCPSSSKSFKTLATWAAAPSNEPAPIIHSGGVSSTAKTMDAGNAANATTYGKGERAVYLK